MSHIKDISESIFGDLYALEHIDTRNTHAIWKCLCMCCNEIIEVPYSNLISENTKSCQKCGNKKTNYKQECEIIRRVNNGEKITHIANDFQLNRGVIYRIKDEWKNYQ